MTAVATLGVVVVTALPASAHTHAGQSSRRAEPAVVYLRNIARADVTLIDEFNGITLVRSTYRLQIAAGSGFAVNPDGTLVTANSVVNPGNDIRVYAANKIFAEHYGVVVPADFVRHTVTGNAHPSAGSTPQPLNARLQSCYPPYTEHSTCIVNVTNEIRVWTDVQPALSQGYPAEVVSAGTRSGVAVLKVAATSMPTVPLAPTAAGVEPVDVFGFTGPPVPAVGATVVPAHLSPPGSRHVKPGDVAPLGSALDKGVVGGPAVNDKNGNVIGLVTGSSATPISIVPAQQIHAALSAAHVTATRGPADAAFDVALGHFDSHHYGDAVPALQQVLKLFPGQAVASRDLRAALRLRGGPQDLDRMGGMGAAAGGPSGNGGVSWMWPAVAGAGALLVVVATFLAVRRRRRGGAGAAAAPPTAAPTPSTAVHHSETVTTNRPGGVSPTAPPDAVPAQAAAQPASAPPGHVAPAARPAAAPASVDPSPGERPRAPTQLAVAPSATPRPASDAAHQHGDQPRYCVGCGMRLAPYHQFCGFCGETVSR